MPRMGFEPTTLVFERAKTVYTPKNGLKWSPYGSVCIMTVV
jgi:hypothetical protein